MPIIEIRKLTKKYNDTVVLNDINASFEKGLIYGLSEEMVQERRCFYAVFAGSFPLMKDRFGLKVYWQQAPDERIRIWALLLKPPVFFIIRQAFKI